MIGFRSSSALAAAYGIAVTMTMVITTVLRVRGRAAASGAGAADGRRCRHVDRSSSIDLAFFGANALKIAHGGWVPLVIGAVVFTADDDLEDAGGRSSASGCARARCRSTEFLQGHRGEAAAPRAGHGGLHDRQPARHAADAAAQPRAQQGAARAGRAADRHHRRRAARARARSACASSRSAEGFFRVTRRVRVHGGSGRARPRSRARRARARTSTSTTTTFFLGRETLLATDRPGMAVWREQLFVADVAQRGAGDGVLQDPAGAGRRARHAGGAVTAGPAAGAEGRLKGWRAGSAFDRSRAHSPRHSVRRYSLAAVVQSRHAHIRFAAIRRAKEPACLFAEPAAGCRRQHGAQVRR